MSEAPPAFTCRAEITLDDPERVLADLLAHMEEHVTVTRSESGARLESPFAVVEITQMAGTVTLDVTAPAAEILPLVRQFVAEHVFEFGGEAAQIHWSDETPAGSLPPRFGEVRVLRAFDVTPQMRRVVFTSDRAGAFAEAGAGYHIRLLIPPEGRTPRWPVQRPDGRLDWPEGEDALAIRVYTIRAVDAAAGTLEVDFVLHGDRAAGPGHTPCPGADFARRAKPGDVAGMIGPGGDGLPEADYMVLLGDEAALPAMARMLAEAPPGATITAFAEIAGPAEEQSLPGTAEVTLTWLHRNGRAPDAGDLLHSALSDLIKAGAIGPGTIVWAGCEKTVAARLRASLLEHLPDRKRDFRIQTYWTAGA